MQTMTWIKQPCWTITSLNASIHRCHHCLSLLNTVTLKLSKENPENLPPLSGSPENMHMEHLKLPEGSPEKLLCTEDEVMYLCQTIDISEASGAPVTKLFNQSILTGCFPVMWKRSYIVPIPKNGDKTNPANYKPISLLPILSNFRRGILWTSCYISDSQCSFQSGKSTVTALLETTHNWFKR